MPSSIDGPLYFHFNGNIKGKQPSTDLFKDEEVEENHAEVVDDEGFAELESLSVLHVFGPQPEEEQVGGADGQRGEGVVHQGPLLHSLVCGDRRYLHKVFLMFTSEVRVSSVKPERSAARTNNYIIKTSRMFLPMSLYVRENVSVSKISNKIVDRF